MPDKRVAPYGSWKSPITSELIASGTTGFGQTAIDGEDVYWIERRASEGGRNVIMRRTPEGDARELTPPEFNVRTTVHEYGGGDFTVADGVVYFSNYADQRVYRQRLGDSPVAGHGQPSTCATPTELSTRPVTAWCACARTTPRPGASL